MTNNNNNNNNNDIIEFLIECLVISKLSGENKNDKRNASNFISCGLKNSLCISKKMLDMQMDKLIDVSSMEEDYTNFDMVYSYKEN